jgi:hypothetical protein
MHRRIIDQKKSDITGDGVRFEARDGAMQSRSINARRLGYCGLGAIVYIHE